MPSRVSVVSERLPIARWVLKVLRDKNSGIRDFRDFMRLAGIILAIETSRELEWKHTVVETPLNVRVSELDLPEPPLLVGILGASLSLLEGFQAVYREAPITLIAAKRREDVGGVSVDVFYLRAPRAWRGTAIVVDPMLATGKTVEYAVREAKARGSRKVVVASIIASKQGVEFVGSLHPDVPIYCLALDPELNDRYFIVPGLGDAGDRALGVEA